MMPTTLQRSEIAGLSAIETGDGQPVLLLHGVGLQAEAWGAQIKALAGAYHVIAPDMPGHGQSRLMEGVETLADYATAIAQVLDQQPVPALVIGHSMGAMIALELAIRMPQKVSGVAALNAVFRRSPKAAAAVKARANSLDGITTPDPTPTLTRWFGAKPSAARTSCEKWLRTADPKGYKQAYTAFANADGPRKDALTALACPALCVTGAQEPNSTPQMSRAMAAQAPLGQALIIEGAAHMMPMTHADQVNTALMAFAQQVSA